MALVLVALAAGAYGYQHVLRRHSPHAVASPRAALAPPEPPAPPPAIVAARTEGPAAPAARPTRMTPAQQAGFDAWLVKTYLQCWKPAGQPADADVYVAQVRLAYNPDGSLMKPAKLVNPPSDPALKPQARSVMAAVESCNPLPVPAQYRPFYEQWKTKTIHFDPQVAAR
jgi:hypothetical protein